MKKLFLPFTTIFSGFVNPHYVVVVENGQYGLFDLKGNRIFESIYNGFCWHQLIHPF
ncbi:MAG: hypothetical protein R2769_00310 [Saprospiraceae bacterium]